MSVVAETTQIDMPSRFFSPTARREGSRPDRRRRQSRPEITRVRASGGCSGFQYGFTFDEVTNEDDTTMTKNGVSLLIDAMSYQYLVGAEIDYKEICRVRSL